MDDPESVEYQFGEFRIDARKRLLFRNETAVPLMPKVFDLLLYFVTNAGRVLGKDQLMAEIWNDTIVEESNLSQNVSILRRSLGEKPSENRFIATIPGKGYKFVAAVTGRNVVDSDPPAAGSHTIGVDNDPSGVQPADPSSSDPPRHYPYTSVYILLPAFLVAAAIVAFIYIWTSPSADPGTVPIRTIAVLPFKPLTAGQKDEALELGMADTLIAELSGGSDLIVRPISSVRKFAQLNQDAIEAGRELEVEAVLDGSIQRSGDRVRVNVRLIKITDGSSLWSETYDEHFTDIFDLQDTIAEKAASALRISLKTGQRRYTENLEAYQTYMKGRLNVLRATRPEILAGISDFEQAIKIDPNYALAHAGLADAYRTLALGGEMRPLDVLPKAKAAALRAVEIDEKLSEAQTLLGSALFWFDWNWNEAEARFRRALELDPNNADAHSEYAFLLSNTGRSEESLAAIRKALELDPLNLRTNAREGQFLLHADRPEEARARLRKTVELDPDYWLAHQFLSSVYIVEGSYAESAAEARKVQELNAESTRPIAFGGYALARSGNEREARIALNDLLAASRERYVPAINIATLHLALGETEKALDQLEIAFEQKDTWMTFLKVEPIWDEVRGHPRFIKLIRRMNL